MNIVDRLKPYLTRQNMRYAAAEAIGITFGYGAAVWATTSLQDIVGDEWNVIGTIAAKGAAFFISNISAYATIHYAQGGGHLQRELSHLVHSHIRGAGITTGLRLIGHYGLLRSGLVPYWAAPLIVYPAAGISGAVYRHYRNHENGIFRIPQSS
ncbi:hypothetical protein HY491_01785 [Candidatus Woesearchaeota archaeon]|nr:hypothetical protein [Candidatus Woesearchaeota archaeon]